MTVTTFTRWKGGKPDDMVNAAKTARSHIMKHGAEMVRLSRFQTGQFVGEWLVVVRYADWTSYGKAQDGLAKDAGYQKLLGQVSGMAELTGRNVLVGFDIE